MAKKKKKRRWMFRGIMVAATVFLPPLAVYRAEYISIPEGTAVAKGLERFVDFEDGTGIVFCEIKPAEAVSYRYIKDCPLSKKMQQGIFEVCLDAGVSFELVMALICRESGWDPACVSDGGQSVGLMQIQERWHRDTGTSWTSSAAAI